MPPFLDSESDARTANRRRGSALLASLLVVVTLAGIVVSVFTLGLATQREVSSQEAELRALYLAESGVSEALLQLEEALDAGLDPPTTFGSPVAPGRLASGDYWASLTQDADGIYWLTSTGAAKGARRSLSVAVRPPVGDPFDHAVFAGNSSGDPNYELRLSGVGAQADLVDGDVFSGGDVRIDDDASVTSGIYTSGTITGASGREGVKRPIPDIAGMNYAVNNDFDVAALFAAGATRRSNALGGTAGELPQDSPGHIFRLNPDDRATEINATTKDDYFLEDPYEPVNEFAGARGRTGHSITLSGLESQPGPAGSGKVYYIDGNLWVHNKRYYSMRFKHEGHGVQVTFVVRGNVYFSDDVMTVNKQKDGVAFIAIEDPAVPDSGNIYLGDPRFGTLDEMHSFLYAENDFYDYNLSADGSSTVDIYGNMTAGNQVAIKRDFTAPDGSTVHSRLTVRYDDRLRTGSLVLPGLPRLGRGASSAEVLLWREVGGQ